MTKASAAGEWGERLTYKDLNGQRSKIGVTAATKQNARARESTTKLHLALTLAFMKALGEPTRVDVRPGTKGFAGKVMLIFGPGGEFKITRTKGCGGRIATHLFEPIPTEFLFPATACVIESYDAKTAVIMLPFAQWEESAAAARES